MPLIKSLAAGLIATSLAAGGAVVAISIANAGSVRPAVDSEMSVVGDGADVRELPSATPTASAEPQPSSIKETATSAPVDPTSTAAPSASKHSAQPTHSSSSAAPSSASAQPTVSATKSKSPSASASETDDDDEDDENDDDENDDDGDDD